MMNRQLMIGALIMSVVVSVIIYSLPGYRLKKMITAKEWMGVSELLFSEQPGRIALSGDEETGTVEKVAVFTNTRYLPDGVFIKVTHINLFTNDDQDEASPLSVEFTESGQWELHRNYLLLKDTEVSNVPTERSLNLSKDQVSDLRARLLMTEQQSKRVELINDRTILLTGLNQESQLLHTN